MKLKISNYKDAKKIVKSGWATKIISIVDCEESKIIKENDENRITGIFLDNLVNPTKDKVYPIFNFFKNIKNEDNVLIHCSQGISRSTAIAFCLLYSKIFTYDKSMEILYSARPQACPNGKIIELFDDYLNKNGKLYKVYQENKYKDYIEQYDEIDFSETIPTEEELTEYDNSLNMDELSKLINSEI